jgi:hypothetical protein
MFGIDKKIILAVILNCFGDISDLSDLLRCIHAIFLIVY